MNTEGELEYTARECLEIHDRHGEFAMLNHAVRLGKPISHLELRFDDGSRIECVPSPSGYRFHPARKV